jgi:hypothetical protein
VTVRLMIDGELTRLEVLRDLDRQRLTTGAAAQLLGLGRRQVFRLLKAYRIADPAGLIWEAAWLSEQPVQARGAAHQALALIRERYWDFGPSLAAEELRGVLGITLGRKTLRLWMGRSRVVA